MKNLLHSKRKPNAQQLTPHYRAGMWLCTNSDPRTPTQCCNHTNTGIILNAQICKCNAMEKYLQFVCNMQTDHIGNHVDKNNCLNRHLAASWLRVFRMSTTLCLFLKIKKTNKTLPSSLASVTFILKLAPFCSSH